MFGTERPWLGAYEGRVEAETEVFDGSLYDLFRRAAEEHRGKTALTFYGTTFGFERLQALVEKMAGSLAAGGVKKGDRVALMLPNCLQYVVSFFATERLGAIVTHRNLVANVQQTIDVFVKNPDQFTGRKCVGALPFFHIYGLTCVMLFCIKLGVEQVLLPRFEVQEALAVFENDRPTMFAGIPTMYMALLASGADLRKHYLHDVTIFNSGGSALLVNLKRSFEEKVGKPLFEGYGLSRDSQQPAVPGAGTRGKYRHPHSFDRGQSSRRGDGGDRDANRRVGRADHQGPAGYEGLPEHAGGDRRDP